MEMFDIIFLATWFAAGFVTGVSGMGGAMVAVPILVTFIAPATLFPVSCIVATVLSLYMAWLYYKDCDYKILKRLLLGVVPGSLAGVALLLYVKAQYIQLIAGIVMVLFVYLQILRDRKVSTIQRAESLGKSLLVGFTAGILITSISFGGPPVAAYALYLGWSRVQAVSIINVFGLLAFLVAMIFQASAGLYTSEVLSLAATGSIASVVGVICATPLAKIIPLKTFKLILLIIIGCGGVLCVWRGLGL